MIAGAGAGASLGPAAEPSLDDMPPAPLALARAQTEPMKGSGGEDQNPILAGQLAPLPSLAEMRAEAWAKVQAQKAAKQDQLQVDSTTSEVAVPGLQQDMTDLAWEGREGWRGWALLHRSKRRNCRSVRAAYAFTFEELLSEGMEG